MFAVGDRVHIDTEQVLSSDYGTVRNVHGIYCIVQMDDSAKLICVSEGKLVKVDDA